MKYSKRIELDVPAEFAYEWHEKPGALMRLLPPWENVDIHFSSGGIQKGDRVEMSVPMGPFRKRWVAEHGECIPGQQFKDTQLSGPFKKWEHTHLFESLGPERCAMTDEIEYELPFGPLGKMGSSFVTQKLESMFAYRHARTAVETSLHYQFRDKPRLRVLITGSTGLIGQSLVSFLTTGGHEVVRLVRDEAAAKDNPHAIFWDIKEGEIDRLALEGFDAVIHLAGAGIADHRWTKSYKETIEESRTKSTKLLATMLSILEQKPKVLISTSAIGFYGDRGDEVLTEESDSGIGFLPQVAREWESSADAARNAGIRVVHPRLGVVISPEGGALEKMRRPFEWGVGGVVGSGDQYWSSISLHDVVGIFHHMLMNEEIEGPVNVVLPESSTNREFTKTLGKVLSRPTVLPVPAFAIKLGLGEMGKTLLLDSTRCVPDRLINAGYQFQTPTLEETFRQMLGRYQNS